MILKMPNIIYILEVKIMTKEEEDKAFYDSI